MKKPSPGPWSFDSAVVGSDKTGKRVCSSMDAENWEANAKLICAAPELLKVCQRLERYIKDNGWTVPMEAKLLNELTWAVKKALS